MQSSLQYSPCIMCDLSDNMQEHVLICHHEVKKNRQPYHISIIGSVVYEDLVGPLDRKLQITKAYQIIIKTRERFRATSSPSLPGHHRYIKEQLDLLNDKSYSVNVKNSNNDELKKTAQGYKCGEWDLKGKTNVSLNKHTNTKHGGFNEKTQNQETDLILNVIGDLF